MSIGIVSPEELMTERTSGNPRTLGAVLIDARRQDAYRKGHIPGALWMGWESWCKQAPEHAGPILAQEGYWGVLAPIDTSAYSHRLACLGLSDSRPIVVYADGPMTRGREGRIAWMLLYFGACEVYLLDAGWSGWLAAGGAVQLEDPAVDTGVLTVHLQSERRRALEELQSAYRAGALPVLIDSRSESEFTGEVDAYLPRRGHLPGAQLFPFVDLFESDGRYITGERYRASLPPLMREASNIVAYCEVGVRASLFALLHEAYTGEVVPVYDGSLMEWGLQGTLPVEAMSGTGVSTGPAQKHQGCR